MTQPSRRDFLGLAAAAAMGCGASRLAGADAKKRRFTMDLACGAIGVRVDQREAIRLARLGGFESVQPNPASLAKLTESELDELLQALKSNQLTWGVAGLPVDFRRDEPAFRSSLAGLGTLAGALQRAGGTRFGTWISPSHAEFTYRANFAQHAARLREIAKVLGDHGQRLGLEYVGPKLSWSRSRFPFIHSMAEARELIAEIGAPNVGLTLDSWHWYTAGETQSDLLNLLGSDVVSCHLNDAPAGIPVDQQIDNQRALPAATGVIDLQSFLGALVEIDYDGPVYAEPFDRELNALDDEQAVATAAAAMRKAFALVG